jgi:hypothetical protein
MKNNANLRKVLGAFLIYLISVPHLTEATEIKPGDVQEKSKGAIAFQIREEVNRILKKFKHDMEEYYRRTRTTQIIYPSRMKNSFFVGAIEEGF